MLKVLQQKKAQAVASEYVVVFFIVAAAIGAITIYLRRAIQARVYDARNTMLEMVHSRANGKYVGNILTGYEPYYLNKDAFISKRAYVSARLEGDDPGTSGIYKSDFDTESHIKMISVTLPPKVSVNDPGKVNADIKAGVAFGYH